MSLVGSRSGRLSEALTIILDYLFSFGPNVELNYRPYVKLFLCKAALGWFPGLSMQFLYISVFHIPCALREPPV